MSRLTYSALEGSSAEFYRTTTFEFDTSATVLSGHAIVTTTISEPAGNWAGDAGPIHRPLEAPETVPLTGKFRIAD
jgi:hypothetical protein